MNKQLWNKFVINALENFVAPYAIIRKIFPQLILLGLGIFNVKKFAKISELPKGAIPLIVVKEDGKLDPFFEKDYELKVGEKIIILADPKIFGRIKEMLE